MGGSCTDHTPQVVGVLLAKSQIQQIQSKRQKALCSACLRELHAGSAWLQACAYVPLLLHAAGSCMMEALGSRLVRLACMWAAYLARRSGCLGFELEAGCP